MAVKMERELVVCHTASFCDWLLGETCKEANREFRKVLHGQEVAFVHSWYDILCLLNGKTVYLKASRCDVNGAEYITSSIVIIIITVCASEAVAQCIVIGPVCGFVCVCWSVTTITRNCLH